jgi:hypothetical protein
MHDHPGRLVDDEDVLVLVNDHEVTGLRFQIVRGGRRKLDLDLFTSPESMGGFANLPIHPDQSAPDEGLKADAREVGQAAGEPLVESSPGRGEFDRDPGDVHP